MNNSRMFLRAFLAATVILFLLLYQMEGAIYESVNGVAQRLSNPHVPISEQLILAWTAFYVALCGLILPTPAELPLALAAKVQLWKIILASALGKAIGSSLLFTLCSLGLKLGKHNAIDLRRSLARGRGTLLFKGNRIGITYAICQAVPFAPMRSATVGYSLVAKLQLSTLLIIAASSFFGTVSRMLIIGGLAVAGIAVLS